MAIEIGQGLELTQGYRNRQSKLSSLSPYMRLPKIFVSEWSYAQYRLPAQAPSSNLAALSAQVIDPTAERVEEERCTVAWIEVPIDTIPPAPLSTPSPKPDKTKSTSHSLKSVANPNGPAMEYQLVALTYSGGWYRLSLPPVAGTVIQSENRPTTPSGGRATGSVLSSSPKDASVLFGLAGRGKGGEGTGKGVDKSKEKEGKTKGKEEPEVKEVKEKQSRQCVLEEFRRFGRWDGWG